LEENDDTWLWINLSLVIPFMRIYSLCCHEHGKYKKRRSPMIFWTDCHKLPIEFSYFPCSQMKHLDRRDFFHVNNLTESQKCLFLSCFSRIVGFKWPIWNCQDVNRRGRRSKRSSGRTTGIAGEIHSVIFFVNFSLNYFF
jgi:hypothetical protein